MFGDLFAPSQIPLNISIMDKSRHAITNWPQYNKSLIQRGSLTWGGED
ncbi:hypothetical protein B224_p00026 (plasmid) [Aeromonas media WS]|nr:hypothetical protein B224_p00026 [Aeromonas media WS]